MATIASLKNLNEATVRTIYKNKDQIEVQGSYKSKSSADSVNKIRSEAILTMESLFKAWIIDCDQRRVPIFLQETQFKAMSLFKMAKRVSSAYN